MSKTFSRLDKIPRGYSSYNMTKGCLVLEGGAFRGLYTEGVLDYFMEQDLNFQCVIGVSAGALNGANYVAGQIGRSARINLSNRYNRDYIGAKALIKSHSLINLDFLFDSKYVEPLNKRHFYNSQQRFVAVVTNCLTGKAEFFEKDDKNILQAVKASATMPYIAPPVEIEGVPYYDGGCSSYKLPFQWAIDEGYDKIVVVKTREDSYRKRIKESHMASRVYKKYPEFAKVFEESDRNYNHLCYTLEQLRQEGRIFVVSPSQEVKVERIEKDVEKLGELYELGYRDAENNLSALKEYLK